MTMVNLQRFQFWGRSPLTIVEFIIGVASVISGLYVASPFIQYSAAINGATPLVAIIGNPIVLAIYGVILALTGIIIIAGIFKRHYKWRSVGLFSNICLRIFGLLSTFIVMGFLPLTWISSAVLILIAAVCYIVVRGFIAMGEK